MAAATDAATVEAEGDRPVPLAIDGDEPVRRRLDLLSPGLPDAIGMRRQRFPSRLVRARREIVREGERPIGVQVLRAGWAAYVRHFPDGRRQIQHLLLPGDPIAFDRSTPAPSVILALTPVTLIDVDGPRAPDADMFDGALHRHGMLTIHHLLNAAARLGRQSALERFAHLLLELRDRLAQVGLCQAMTFEFPLTQEMLADTLGLTSVHVNRTLQSMRQQRLIALGGREMTLLQPEALAELADYQSPSWPAPATS